MNRRQRRSHEHSYAAASRAGALFSPVPFAVLPDDSSALPRDSLALKVLRVTSVAGSEADTGLLHLIGPHRRLGAGGRRLASMRQNGEQSPMCLIIKPPEKVGFGIAESVIRPPLPLLTRTPAASTRTTRFRPTRAIRYGFSPALTRRGAVAPSRGAFLERLYET